VFLDHTMQMTSDNWDRAKELFAAALELDPSQRAGFLAENCREESLRQQVEKLLINYQAAGNFLDVPVLNPIIPAPNAPAEIVTTTAAALDESPAQPAETWIGCRVGPYKIVEQIGAGLRLRLPPNFSSAAVTTTGKMQPRMASTSRSTCSATATTKFSPAKGGLLV
jgi:hypothetical protein